MVASQRQLLLFYVICCILMFIQETGSGFISRCYNVTNYQHCLWTDLTLKNWDDAKVACRANNSVLVSVTSSELQSALEQFRSYVNSSYPATDNVAAWIDVYTEAIDSFHWISGDRGEPLVDNQNSDDRRFGAIANISNNVYSAEKWSEQYYYICQYQDVGCIGGHQRSSKCHRKYDNETVTWFNASNRCLSMGGSLATFNDLTRPTGESSLTSWLNITGTAKYWIGLVRRWLVTAGQNGSVVDVQYTKWSSGYPSQTPVDNPKMCVALRSHGFTWLNDVNCVNNQTYFVCQESSRLSPASVTTASSSSAAAAASLMNTTLPPTSTDGEKLSASSTTRIASGSRNPVAVSVGVGVGVGIGVPVIITVVVIIAVLLRRRRKRKHKNGEKSAANSKKPIEVKDVKVSSDIQMSGPPVRANDVDQPPIDVSETSVYAKIGPAANCYQVAGQQMKANTGTEHKPSSEVIYSELEKPLVLNKQISTESNTAA